MEGVTYLDSRTFFQSFDLVPHNVLVPVSLNQDVSGARRDDGGGHGGGQKGPGTYKNLLSLHVMSSADSCQGSVPSTTSKRMQRVERFQDVVSILKSVIHPRVEYNDKSKLKEHSLLCSGSF